jgi:NAD(P)-dependent dehydrogenase (short-subunit alcohol dehydrogenase family)
VNSLAGQTVLITGGASGLGLAIAGRFIEEGARLVLFDRDGARLDAARAGLGVDRVACLTGDVRSPTDNAAAVALALRCFGRLDCAIGNAGIWDYSTPIDAIASEQIDPTFDELFHINVKGAIHLAKAALPLLVQSRGSLIYTISNAGFAPDGGGVFYTASKHALVGLIRQLAHEWAPVVRVNGVAPGPIATDLRGPAALGLANLSIGSIGLSERAAPAVPLGFVPEADDYAGAYVLLASRRDARAATGGVIMLDTGIQVRGIGATARGGDLAAKYGETGA